MAGQEGDEATARFTEGSALEVAAYQSGAIVSREIVARKEGTVTAFAFDEGQGLSEHTSPFDAVVDVLDGVAEITIGGTSRRLRKDDMVLMPADVPHAVKAVQRFKMLLTMIRSA